MVLAVRSGALSGLSGDVWGEPDGLRVDGGCRSEVALEKARWWMARGYYPRAIHHLAEKA